MKELLEHRAKSKGKKPPFIRQETHKKKRLAKVWRRPKGGDSKLRLQFKDKGKIVKTGYGSPVGVKGLTRDGKELISVSRVADLEGIDVKTQVGVIGSTVGQRNRVSIIEAAIKAGVTLTNGDQKTLDAIANDLKARKDAKKKASEKKDAEKVVDKKADKKEVKENTSEENSEDKKEADLKKQKELIKKGAQ